MKKLVLLFTALALVTGLAAADPPILKGYSLLPLANTDGFQAPLVNPAALSFGNSSGLAFAKHYYNDLTNDEIKNDKDYSIFFNTDNLAYVFHNMDNKVSDHTVAFSNKIVRNLYFGSVLNWQNAESKTLNFSYSLLWRPTDWLSTAAKASNLFEDPDNLKLQAGIAVRPIPLDGEIWDRLTVTADVNWGNYPDYDEDGKLKNRLLKPTVGLQTELLDGLKLGGAWQLEDETAMVNLSLSLNGLQLGQTSWSTRDADDEQKFDNAYSYVWISDKAFRALPFIPREQHFTQYAFGQQVYEQKPSFKIGPIKIITGKGKTLEQIKAELKKLQNDPQVKGILFKNTSFAASFANYAALEKALKDFKAAGKYIAYYQEGFGNGNYALAASVADKIYLNPMGEVDLHGISITQPYIKTLLDTLGVDFYNFRSHPYKTAGNMFSETEMTPAEREALDAVLTDLYAQMQRMIEEGRGDKLSADIATIIDNGPYMRAEDAMQAGLVDEIIYEDQLHDQLLADFGNKNITTSMPEKKKRQDWSDPDKFNVAVIYALGSIHSGTNDPNASIGSETYAKLIKSARENKDIDAIVLRVDSGGGSALASDVIARQVELCHQGPNQKPVVASMGGVAASGGYYISCLADKIVAEPTTITGSIGVIGLIPNLTRLFDKIWVNWSTVKKGKHADLGSMSRPMTEEEQNKIRTSIEAVYNRFVGIVAKGRNMDVEDVKALAQGRIWSGEDAKQSGLIDELGGLDKATELAAQLAGTTKEVNTINYSPTTTGITISIDGDLPFFMQAKAVALPHQLQKMADSAQRWLKWEDETALTVMPYEIPDKVK